MKSLSGKVEFKKGMVIGHDWFYVVVRLSKCKKWVYCICDNANNIYSHEIKDIENQTDPHEWIIFDPFKAEYGFGNSFNELFKDLDERYSHLQERGLPFEVMLEVILGFEDNRFDHWD